MTEHTRALLAEACGSLWCVLIGAGAIVTNQATNGAVGLLGIALAHGLALSIAISSFGAIRLGATIGDSVAAAFRVRTIVRGQRQPGALPLS